MQDLFQAGSLEYASYAEDVGVDSSIVRQFFEECQEKGYNFKNFIVGRFGKVAVSCTKRPFVRDFPHTSFSFAKSITAIAVGFAINEGLLHLDTTMGEIFEDTLSEKQLRNVKNISIEHLLTMTAGKGINFLANKEKTSWLKYFCNGKPKAKPGEKFLYISENTYVLSRMLTEVTGLTITEYLKPRLFEPLGIEKPFWETDLEGYEAGGWGLFLKVEDVAKIAQCFLNMGVWDGVQVIPEDWIRLMTEPKISDLPSLYAENLGYGYQVWSAFDGSYYRFEGLFGQYIFVFPKHNAYIAMNSGDVRQFIIFPLIDKYFPLAFKDEEIPVDEDTVESFNNYIRNITYRPILECGPRNLASEAGLNKNVYKFLPHLYFTMQSSSVSFALSKKPGNINNLSFEFLDDFAVMTWEERNYGKNKICINLDGKARYSTVKLGDNETHIVAFGRWLEDDRFKFQVFTAEMPEVKTFTVTFTKKGIRIRTQVKTTLEDMIMFKSMFEGYHHNFIVKAIAKLAKLFGEPIFYPRVKRGKLRKDK